MNIYRYASSGNYACIHVRNTWPNAGPKGGEGVALPAGIYIFSNAFRGPLLAAIEKEVWEIGVDNRKFIVSLESFIGKRCHGFQVSPI